MAIKRYSPKYKKLVRFHYPLWPEKRIKIRKFNKEKWQRSKKLYYPRELRFFRQDVSSAPLTRLSNSERFIRLKKTYKFLLRDKQRLQHYYGVGKLRHFQLKNMAKKVHKLSVTRKTTVGKAMLSLFEDRLDISLYRLSIARSIPQARRLIADGRVQVGSVTIRNSSYLLKPEDVISFDPCFKDHLFGLYLRNHMPFYFFRKKERRRQFVKRRKDVWEKSFIDRKNPQTWEDFFHLYDVDETSLSLMENFLSKEKKKKNDSIEN